MSWNTAGLAPGTYTLGVWARAAGSNAVMDVSNISSYTLTPPPTCTATTVAGGPASPQASGTTVTLNATVTCDGGAPAEYRFWVLPPGGQWQLLREWGGASMSWNTAGLAPGTYTLGVWARAAGSNAVLDVSNISSYTLR
jgi:hypothetical protein